MSNSLKTALTGTFRKWSSVEVGNASDLAKHWKVLVPVLLLIVAGIGVIAANAHLSEQEARAKAKFTEAQRLAASYKALTASTGTQQVADGTTLFSRVESLMKSMKMVRRVATIRAESSNGVEQVRLVVNNVQTHELVRLLFRIERTLGNVEITQTQVVKQAKGLAVTLLVRPA